LPYHPVDDFTPITQMTEGGLLLVVNPSHPAKNAKEFLQWARTTKDPINFGSAGIGSGGHLAGELFKLMTGSQGQHIPYKGTGPAIVGLLGGEYHYNFMGLTGAFGQVRAGKLRAIAVSTSKRLVTAPDIPAMSEVLPGFEVVGWYGVAAPAKLPKPLLEKIHAGVVSLVKSPEFIKTMRDNGSEAKSSTPEELRQFMLSDMKKWADVVKRAGIKPR
jgi:tripartite-type tricarboxylate transporter receptor subunit TctC